MKSSIPHHTYERMLQRLEGKLSPQEQWQLEEEMRRQPALQQAFSELERLYELGQQADFHFRPFLAGRVMQRLKQVVAEENPMQALQFAFRRLALPAFAVMLLLLVVTMAGEQGISLDAIIGTADLHVEDVYSQYILSL